jgi:hypothetical protein
MATESDEYMVEGDSATGVEESVRRAATVRSRRLKRARRRSTYDETQKGDDGSG